MVEALVEGSGTDEVSAWVTRQLNSRHATQHFGNVRTLCSDDAHRCGEINERKESGA